MVGLGQQPTRPAPHLAGVTAPLASQRLPVTPAFRVVHRSTRLLCPASRCVAGPHGSSYLPFNFQPCSRYCIRVFASRITGTRECHFAGHPPLLQVVPVGATLRKRVPLQPVSQPRARASFSWVLAGSFGSAKVCPLFVSVCFPRGILTVLPPAYIFRT